VTWARVRAVIRSLISSLQERAAAVRVSKASQAPAAVCAASSQRASFGVSAVVAQVCPSDSPSQWASWTTQIPATIARSCTASRLF
jgi:hypothetical protein